MIGRLEPHASPHLCQLATPPIHYSPTQQLVLPCVHLQSIGWWNQGSAAWPSVHHLHDSWPRQNTSICKKQDKQQDMASPWQLGHGKEKRRIIYSVCHPQILHWHTNSSTGESHNMQVVFFYAIKRKTYIILLSLLLQQTAVYHHEIGPYIKKKDNPCWNSNTSLPSLPSSK
jgi:hypothetical protein